MKRTHKEISRIKTVRVTTRTYRHSCTAECFKRRHRPQPNDLHKISLGHVYQSSDGQAYIKWGNKEWLPVAGMTFGSSADGGLMRVFQPACSLHIHSRGGSTLSRAITRKEIGVNESYHAREAAKKLKRKGHNLRAAQDYVSGKVREVIPPAPRHRRGPSNAGRGAPGRPRTPQGEEVTALLSKGMGEAAAVRQMMTWYKQRGLRSDRNSIKKLVHRWFRRKK